MNDQEMRKKFWKQMAKEMLEAEHEGYKPSKKDIQGSVEKASLDAVSEDVKSGEEEMGSESEEELSPEMIEAMLEEEKKKRSK